MNWCGAITVTIIFNLNIITGKNSPKLSQSSSDCLSVSLFGVVWAQKMLLACHTREASSSSKQPLVRLAGSNCRRILLLQHKTQRATQPSAADHANQPPVRLTVELLFNIELQHPTGKACCSQKGPTQQRSLTFRYWRL